ncbi:MAG TPA: transglutaminase-like domain-containing protein [Candidatus Nanoarchaeia archaeon]|nr:transglutaminase-like domain-containing protein [Candidatus Nanoarchaeia archaeon]
MDEAEKERVIGDEEPEPKDPWYKGPIRYILMLFLLLTIILWYFPAESIKLDPEPTAIPSLSEVLPDNFKPGNTTIKGDFYSSIQPNDPQLKQLANRISTYSCDGNQVCQAKALYYFVRDNIEYVSDPLNSEYIESPKEVLYTKASDCEGGAILLASLMASIGIDYELVFIPSHVFIKIKLDKAMKRYKTGDWIYLDWTCKGCRFGEVPLKDKVN